ncbi:unnamed protein product [Symbiodinium sp. CCMP2592]|nr:unnamed protein product [Symbiodinium sp. CCMP2592]
MKKHDMSYWLPSVHKARNDFTNATSVDGERAEEGSSLRQVAASDDNSMVGAHGRVNLRADAKVSVWLSRPGNGESMAHGSGPHGHGPRNVHVALRCSVQREENFPKTGSLKEPSKVPKALWARSGHDRASF